MLRHSEVLRHDEVPTALCICCDLYGEPAMSPQSFFLLGVVESRIYWLHGLTDTRWPYKIGEIESERADRE